jgi:prophage maintenance system killer protein
MSWTWKQLVELNKLICEASNQPHAIRHEPILNKDGTIDLKRNGNYDSLAECISAEHLFFEANKRTACTIAICSALHRM